MSDEEKTKVQLIKELEERRRRIAEFEVLEVERKDNKEKIKASEERYKLLFENSGSAITFYDAEGKCVLLNKRSARNIGGEPGDFIGKSLYDILPEIADFHMKRLSGIIKQGKGATFEDSVELPGGKRWFSSNIQPVIDERGEVRGVQIISTDITASKQAEEMLRESEEEKSLILNSMSERVSYRDSEMRIIWANKKAGEAANQAPEELIGRYCYEIWHQRNTPCIGCPILQTLKTGKTHESEIIEPDGKIWLVRGYSLKDDKGKVVGAVEFSYDITELKKAEEQIKASLKEKEVLLQEIHHRVKNNMQVVSSLLKLQAGKMKDEKARQAFKESRSRVSAMALVHEALYRSDSMAEIELQKHIPVLVDSIYRTLKIQQRVKLHVDVEDIKLGIGQATPLSLVINELISNSLQHAFPEGKGEIIVKVRSSRDDEIEVVVRDNGRGMPEDIDSDRTLGLQLVTGLVESQLGGTWEVIGEEGTQHTIRFKK